MAYVAPSINPSGLTVPSYQDILSDLIAQAKSIYGNDIYLEIDSADYQLLSVFALKISDTMNAIELAYNSRSPLTAIGSGLDAIIKLNGLSRKAASYSTCQVTLTGIADTVITSGVVKNTAGYKWSLPIITTIGIGGTVTVTATCQTLGSVTATIGDITIIATPTAGWTSVTNSVAAIAGQNVEDDSSLRSRQSISAELPSQTMLTGTIAAIATLSNVTRYKVYENYTNLASTDPNGFNLPPHSITAVVEGSTDNAVAQVIYNNRGLGCYTNGTTTIDVLDATYGTKTTIRFYRPEYVPIYVAMTIKALTGYTSSTTTAIKTAIAAYLNSLQIGEELTISALYGAALSVLVSLSSPTFSIRAVAADITPNPTATNDITTDFYKVFSGDVANITITVT
jgi:uncharacterized phage protein gp47/JayE